VGGPGVLGGGCSVCQEGHVCVLYKRSGLAETYAWIVSFDSCSSNHMCPACVLLPACLQGECRPSVMVPSLSAFHDLLAQQCKVAGMKTDDSNGSS
jgi:hypothetical protein